jgi:hypothetical protein
MSKRKPYIGAVVQYILSEQDCVEINRRRRYAHNAEARLSCPDGAQAHSGNKAQPGQVAAMIIVAVWGNSVDSCVNGQVLLDGNDSFWALSRNRGTNPMNWNWVEEQE